LINIKNFISPYTKGHDIELYLNCFERSCEQVGIPKEKWPLYLQSLLTTELIVVTAQLPLNEALDYECVKLKLLERFQLTTDAARAKFRAMKKEEEQSFPDYAYKLRSSLNTWTKLAGVDSLEKSLDLILMEQFVRDFPPQVRNFIQEKTEITNVEKAALLSEDWVIRKKTNQIEAARLNPKPRDVNANNATQAKPQNANGNTNANGSKQNGRRNNR
jgi:hypothetical protein